MDSSPAILFFLPLLLVASCRAADKSGASTTSAPAGLTASATVTHGETGWVAEITLANNTSHALTTGRFTGFTLTRVDTQPPQAVAASPPEMAPHFRVQLPAGESRKASIVIWDKPDSLPSGTYHVAVTYPADILAAPVEADFTVSGPATQRSANH